MTKETRMRSLKSYIAGALLFGALAVVPYAAAHASVLWSSKQGDLNFPGLSPSPNGADSSPIVASQITLDTGTKTATATGTTTATATLNKKSGKITSPSLTTAAGGTWTLTLTNNKITAASMVFASVATAGTGTPAITKVVPGANQVVIQVQNVDAAAAFNNTLVVSLMVVQP